jgi:K+-sensing histidine kinase KdpD
MSGLDLVEVLGARVHLIEGTTVAEPLAAFLLEQNASTIVMGHLPASTWRKLART